MSLFVQHFTDCQYLFLAESVILSLGVNLIEQESSGLRVSCILTQSVKGSVGV